MGLNIVANLTNRWTLLRARLGQSWGRFKDRAPVWRWMMQGAFAVVVLAALYYPVGMVWIHQVNDDPDFAPTGEFHQGQSKAVAITMALIDRETNLTRWTANEPFFLPAAALDNMPNFQMGILAALSRFGIELADQLGRTRGSSQIDPNLDKAAGLLKYPGTVWMFDLKTSWTPTASSEKQYRSAMRELAAYNLRLAEGSAVYDKRADNLMATLDRFGKDLGSASAAIDAHVTENAGWGIDTKADDVFYGTKGRLYAYYLLLKALGEDFQPIIAERGLEKSWSQMLTTFRTAATVDPFVVVNGAPDSNLFPSHLAAQGFYLLRARTQLQEVANILLK